MYFPEGLEDTPFSQTETAKRAEPGKLQFCFQPSEILNLTGTIIETGTYGVPSKSQKSFICGGVRQTNHSEVPQ